MDTHECRPLILTLPRSLEEVYELLQQGEVAKRRAATAMNERQKPIRAKPLFSISLVPLELQGLAVGKGLLKPVQSARLVGKAGSSYAIVLEFQGECSSCMLFGDEVHCGWMDSAEVLRTSYDSPHAI